MRIDELSIKGFGKWQDAHFQFAPGLNLITAPNERGKTTLLQAIFASLYGMKRDYVRSARYLPEYERYLPWHASSYETVVLYELDGKQYRLHRRLEKEREQAQIYLDPDWSEVTYLYQEDRRKERNFLELHLGLTRSLFTDLTWIRRKPLESAEYLLPSLFGSGETDPAVNRMLAELERELALIGKKERAENTLLGKATALVASKERELAEAEESWRGVQKLTRQLAVWEIRRQELERSLERVNQRLLLMQRQEQDRQNRWQRSFSEASPEDWYRWEQEAQTEAERRLHRQAGERWRAMEESSVEESLNQADDTEERSRLEKMEDAYQKAVLLRKELNACREQAHLLAQSALYTSPAGQSRAAARQTGETSAPGRAAARSQRGNRRGTVRFWWTGSLIGLFAAAALFAAGYALPGSLVSAAAAAAAFGGVMALRNRQRGKGLTVPQQEWQKYQDKAALCEGELHQLLQEWQAADWDDFLIRREELKRSAEGAKASLAAQEWRRQEQKAELLREWGDAFRVLLEQEKALQDHERNTAKQERERISEELLSLREQIAHASGEIGGQDEVSLAGVRSEYEEAAKALRQLQMKREALSLARDTLQQTLKEWNRDISPALNQIASGIMATVTDGKYEDVRLDPHAQFDVKVWEAGHQRIVEQDQCSQGTQDQLYFAQRLALLRHVSAQSEPLPIFLDDHFVHYDAERLEAALQALLELAEEHQVFLFSCTEREQVHLQPLMEASHRHRLHTLRV
ncbi:AAA family ATPase [Brevibacillus ruminantium]|uniref:AAA family ATPase n=1 Tax=Brevibacillus ruminantium TaxID=2950604 RepID=A0ABY4WKY8_9BACL|nr:AAA family ATPase [Brevibacillus ruminantium]USG66803.1 AAA family ATPase [Brevibacillus ruminantium]